MGSRLLPWSVHYLGTAWALWATWERGHLARFVHGGRDAHAPIKKRACISGAEVPRGTSSARPVLDVCAPKLPGAHRDEDVLDLDWVAHPVEGDGARDTR